VGDGGYQYNNEYYIGGGQIYEQRLNLRRS
jgi:hypothetical protein